MKTYFKKDQFTFIALLIILILGAYFRFVGLDWDEGFHLHPDERFLTMIETSLKPVSTISEYFDTNVSSLNPHNILDANGNQTFPFFVYGNFPIILVRYIAEILKKTGYSEVYLVGRALSGIFDIGTIIITFLIARKLTRSNPVALLSALFYACAPLAIQISHFFIVDNFTTFFAMLAFLFAAKIAVSEVPDGNKGANSGIQHLYRDWHHIGPFVGFAFSLGLAAASKINAIVIAPLLPIAVLIKNRKYLRKIEDLEWIHILRNLLIAAIISFFTFRVFQPYAFGGPGFLNISLNPRWIDNLKELSALSSGLSNYPPSLQWTRRSAFFPLKNMFVWGMGIVFGIFSALGFVLTIVKIFKGKWKTYGLLFIWNTIYLIWQILRWNPTMRYFLLIYPTMAISAAMFFEINQNRNSSHKNTILQTAQKGIVLSLLLISLLIPLAFTEIYRTPVSRVSASEWIYENIEGAINLDLNDSSGNFLQPLPHSHQYVLESGGRVNIEFQVPDTWAAERLSFDHIKFSDGEKGMQALNLQIFSKEDYQLLGEASIIANFDASNDFRGDRWSADLVDPVVFKQGEEYILAISSGQTEGFFNFFGSVQIERLESGVRVAKNVFEFSKPLENNQPVDIRFTPIRDAELSSVRIFRIRENIIEDKAVELNITILDTSNSLVIGRGQHIIKPNISQDYRGSEVTIPLVESIHLDGEKQYNLVIEVDDASNEVFLSGSKTAKETDWDDALPLFMHGMNPFDQYSGIYQSDLNFQMYWDDDTEKQARFISILDEADFIIFSSSRQWGSITQAPEKYPLSTFFYRQLIDCDLDNVQSCYIKANTGDGGGALGFELDAVFQSEPELFGLRINSQYAEEAFTVYDHPKVFIFKKSENFDFNKITKSILSVDADQALNIPPSEIEKRPGSLLMPEGRWRNQKQSGTWSGLFNYESAINQNHFLAALLWYLGISLIGVINYPVTRIVFRGLKDKGWGMQRLVGLILLTYLIWIIGSAAISVTRLTIILSLTGLLILNALLFKKDKSVILKELKAVRKEILTSEIILLVLFFLFLAIRLGNPDLWHPYKGGEKPMDFSYFNAVLKSVHFPPYDPWYAGGYINYYYWGFLIAAVPTKLLGIVPSIAYNLILPIFFGFTGIGAFTIGSNLLTEKDSKSKNGLRSNNIILTGILSILFVLIIGNLGTVKMFLEGILKLGRASSASFGTGAGSVLAHFFNGMVAFFNGNKFTYYPGDWYWIPSRAIPGEPITEFPFFTFLYGDPHAHLFALPITLLSLSWAVSIIKSNLDFKNLRKFSLAILMGALITGALRPTNTWDYPVFLLISTIALLYTLIFNKSKLHKVLPEGLKNTPVWFNAVLFSILFAITSYILYLPFTHWYGQGYTSIALWDGDKTPFSSFFIHWGLFIFVITSWLAVELLRWLKITPISKLEPLYKRRYWILSIGVLFLAIWVWLLARGIIISLLVFPLMIVILVFLFRNDITSEKRFSLVLVGVGLGLTLIVETVVLTGDIGRMNTVFKFYIQAWTVLALASSVFLNDLIKTISPTQNNGYKTAWKTILVLLVVSASLYPIIASIDKIKDRMAESVPVTLDGMSYMQYAAYIENDVPLELNRDYDLIRWMQDNVEGTPVIIEAHVPEYRWGNRVSIYTGLPGVIGWNWHQRQQRAINPHDWVFDRVEDVSQFYSTQDISEAISIAEKYNIEYVVIGELERAIYPDAGIGKFLSKAEELFEIVYKMDGTYLLKVKND